MCFEFGSIEQETTSCILCKFHATPLGQECPHQQGLRVCQNRQNHPLANIVHFTNPEFNILNGCGYCRWLKRIPAPTERDKAANKGWPGCCRQPIIKEWELIDEKDWPIVSFRFGIPNPYEHARERARHQPASTKDTASRRLGSSSISARRPSIDTRDIDPRKSSSSPHRRGSPHTSEVTKDSPRLREKDEISGMPPASKAALELVNQFYHQRAAANGSRANPAVPSPAGSQQSVTTTYVVAEERDGGMFHTRPIPRPNAVPVSGSSHIIQQPNRGSAIRRPTGPGSSASSSSGSQYSSSAASSISSAADDRLKLAEISKEFESMSLSRTSSNRDSMTTVMSDGAFTDYLSDESEAELQRQAEERAAQLRRARLDEAEFNAAKKGLANIDIGTPVAWNPTRALPYDPSAYSRR